MESSIHELSNIVLNFLEVFVHQVLFARHIYPEAIFERRREYGVPVWMSRHPLLNAQILELLQSLEPCLIANECESVAVLLKGPDQLVIEKYVVDIGFASSYHVATYADLDMMFATAITRILTLESIGTEMPPGSSFSIASKIHQSPKQLRPHNDILTFKSNSGETNMHGMNNPSSHLTEQLWVPVDAVDYQISQENQNVVLKKLDPRISTGSILKSIRAGNLMVDIRVEAVPSDARM
jgi:hypothetical protein